jgi:hypothetical protein
MAEFRCYLLFIKLLLFFSQDLTYAKPMVSSDSLTYNQKLRSGDYPPHLKLEEEDVIKLPIVFEIEVIVDDLRDVDIKNNSFYTTFEWVIYSSIDTVLVTKNNDTFSYDDPTDFIRVLYPESDKAWNKLDFINDGKFKHKHLKDSVIQWSKYSEFELPHKWELRNYPFDTQNFKIIFETKQDTSYIRLNPSIEFPPKIDPERFKFIQDGYNVKSLKTEKAYVGSGYISDYVEGEREQISEQLIFNVEINRSGSYLFFKLFFGAFLSFLISYLVFFIDPKYFETRITLSLGGIFGAVGNKYFVENSMPALQVLTKADLISNLVIVFIILNIFIVIAQHTSKISLWKLEKNKFSSIFVLALFFLLNLLIVKS